MAETCFLFEVSVGLAIVTQLRHAGKENILRRSVSVAINIPMAGEGWPCCESASMIQILVPFERV